MSDSTYIHVSSGVMTCAGSKGVPRHCFIVGGCFMFLLDC